MQARAQREIFRKHIGHNRRKKHRDAYPEQRRMMDATPVALRNSGHCLVMGAISCHANSFPHRRHRSMEPPLGQEFQRRFIPTLVRLRGEENAIHGGHDADSGESRSVPPRPIIALGHGSRFHLIRGAVRQTASDRRVVTDAPNLSCDDDGFDRLGNYPQTLRACGQLGGSVRVNGRPPAAESSRENSGCRAPR